MTAIVNTSSLTATSVTISWSPQPAQFRLPAVEYTVSLTRVTGSGQVLCTQVMDSRPAVTTTDTSMPFISLEEFSNYTVTVTTTFNVFGSNMDQVTEVIFTTPSAGINHSTLLKFSYSYCLPCSPYRNSTCYSFHDLQEHCCDLGHYRVH